MAGRVPRGRRASGSSRSATSERGEELSYDYNFAHFGGEGTTSFTCMCGHPLCRGTLDANPERTRNYGRRVAIQRGGDEGIPRRAGAELPQQDGEVPRGVRPGRAGTRQARGRGRAAESSGSRRRRPSRSNRPREGGEARRRPSGEGERRRRREKAVPRRSERSRREETEEERRGLATADARTQMSKGASSRRTRGPRNATRRARI